MTVRRGVVRQVRDDAAFPAYVEARGQHLVRLAYLLTGDHQLAQDLVQGVLARTMLSWGRISTIDDVDGYLRGEVVKAPASWWRRFGREHPVASSTGVAGKLAGLPYVERAVLVLRYFEALPDRRIATILDCPEPAVRAHAQHGLQAFASPPWGRNGTPDLDEVQAAMRSAADA